MRYKLFIEFCLTISIICLLAGDLFLPQPYRGLSQQLKMNLNHFISGLLPQSKTIIDTNVSVDSNSLNHIEEMLYI